MKQQQKKIYKHPKAQVFVPFSWRYWKLIKVLILNPANFLSYENFPDITILSYFSLTPAMTSCLYGQWKLPGQPVQSMWFPAWHITPKCKPSPSHPSNTTSLHNAFRLFLGRKDSDLPSLNSHKHFIEKKSCSLCPFPFVIQLLVLFTPYSKMLN